MASQVRQYLFS